MANMKRSYARFSRLFEVFWIVQIVYRFSLFVASGAYRIVYSNALGIQLNSRKHKRDTMCKQKLNVLYKGNAAPLSSVSAWSEAALSQPASVRGLFIGKNALSLLTSFGLQEVPPLCNLQFVSM